MTEPKQKVLYDMLEGLLKAQEDSVTAVRLSEKEVHVTVLYITYTVLYITYTVLYITCTVSVLHDIIYTISVICQIHYTKF